MRFSAELTGAEQVPPVNTSATGEADFQYNEGSRQISYRLNMRNIRRVFAAHIHLGRRGVNGPVIAPMFNSSPGITLTQGQVMGTISQGELTGPLEGRDLRDLIDEMNAGNTYVNAHTDQYPDGEIRGQIRRTDR
jgi:hypothetical protein